MIKVCLQLALGLVLKNHLNMGTVNPVSQTTLALALVIVAWCLFKDPIQMYSVPHQDIGTKTIYDGKTHIHAQFLVPTHIRLKNFWSILANDMTGPTTLCKLLHPNATHDTTASKQHCTGKDKKWEKDTRSYIEEEVFDVLNEEDEKIKFDKYVELSALGVTPFHRVMILSGCYGHYMLGNQSGIASSAMHREWFQQAVQTDSTKFVMNLLLQQMENTESLQSSPRGGGLNPDYLSSRDRSMCSCMKDFAAPLTLLSVDDTQRYDTCGAQNLQDYVFNAEEQFEFNNNYDEDPKLADQPYNPVKPHDYEKSLTAQEPMLRNRQDAIAMQIDAFINDIVQHQAAIPYILYNEFRNVTTTNMNHTLPQDKMPRMYLGNGNNFDYTNVGDDTNMAPYSKGVVLLKQILNVFIGSTLLEYDSDEHLPGRINLPTLIRLKPDWQQNLRDIINDATVVNEVDVIDWANTHMSLHHVRNWLHAYARKLYSHNRLQPPIVHRDSLKNTDVANNYRSQQPPKLALAEYEHYTEKYLHAFRMCSEYAAPPLELEGTEFVDTRNYVKWGQSFLLIAAWVGIVSRLTDEVATTKTDDAYKAKYENDPKRKFAFGLCYVSIAVATVLIYGSLIATWNKDVKVERAHDADDLHKQISVVSILYGFNVLIAIISFIVTLVFGFVAVNSWLFVKAANEPQVTPKKEPWTHQYAMYLACGRQIIFDLAVIVALSNMAVAFSMQRGLVFNTALMSVYVLIFTIALLQHLSNLARIVQHILQYKVHTPDPHVMYFAYNRVICVVIVAAGLFAYMFMAGLSYDHWSSMTSFNLAHSWIFTAIAFFILCGFDVGYEVFYKVRERVQEPTDLDKIAHTPNFVTQKLFKTSMVILLGLMILKLHEYLGLCSSFYGADPSIRMGHDDADVIADRMNYMCDWHRFWFNPEEVNKGA